jgi:DNA replication protein DnaC
MNPNELPDTLAAALRRMVAGLRVVDDLPAAPADECPRCKGFGRLLLDVPPDHPAAGTTVVCHCRARRSRPDLQRVMDATLGESPHATRAGFRPDRPLAVAFTWGAQTLSMHQQQAALDAALAAVDAFLDGSDRRWLYLHGPCGSGKSHLARAIVHALADRHQVGMLTAAGMLAYLRDGIETHDVDARLRALAELEILVLDDLGSERPSDWGLARLFDLIDARATQHRPTVLTSNLALHELCPPGAAAPERIAYERIASRIAQHIRRPLALTVSDYRYCHWES